MESVELVLITIPLWNLIQVRENTSTDTVIKCFGYVTALSYTACCKELGHRHLKSQLAFGTASNGCSQTKIETHAQRCFKNMESKVQFYILKCNLRCSNVASVYFQGPKGITLSLFVLSRASFFMLLFLCITVPLY